jgi:uncharacterized protein (TIGR00369 family)
MIKQPTSRTCFMCGRENSHGLKMVWYNNLEANRVEATITIPEQFNGYPGIVHGGIVAAILDETSGRAVMLDGNFENLFVTLRLNVTYRKPTPTNTPLKAIGWLEHKGNRGMCPMVRSPRSARPLSYGQPARYLKAGSPKRSSGGWRTISCGGQQIRGLLPTQRGAHTNDWRLCGPLPRIFCNKKPARAFL